ncbi:natterin-4-like [Mixophyes fleayi]|uniref:natterin-4-like n=1 Tax=Mixophyes fleayi TaxID=3061075 RepID=UPI003F4E3A8A
MKVTWVCLFLSISWTLELADSLALPLDDVKVADKQLPDVLKSNSNVLPADPKRHNVDLSKITTPEAQAAETVERSSLLDTRQLIFNDYVSLKWMDWTGSVPSGAVSINNQYAGRTDYVCSVQTCATGFYSSSKGSYCYYSDAGREYRATYFKILVNEQNFEVIQWLPGSYGSIPPNPISRCSGMYVGKNQYGLGKVVPSSRVLSLPFNGNEYSYDYYEALNLYTNYNTQTLTSVSYTTGQASFYREEVQVLASLKVINNVCNSLSKSVSLSKTTLTEMNWDIGRPTNAGVSTTITGSKPSISGTSISLSGTQDFEWNEGSPFTQSQLHSRSLSVRVSPNNECEVVLQGRTIHTTMPFRGSLTRYYQNGEKRSISITGVFTNVQTDEVAIVLQECRRIANAAPC